MKMDERTIEASDAQSIHPREHVETLLRAITKGLYEKDHIMAIALLCAISGESCFLLGPPGTAKSEVARRLKWIFKDASAFEYLMSRFSTPDELFGPVSIQKLKSEDTYCRKVEGFLPSATVVFLDEIWKAGPAIQNALLTIINEKIYQNGTETIHVPMKCLIAASNELPAADEGLEALWDRFLVRIVSNCISDEKTFYKMLRMEQLPAVTIPDDLRLTEDLYARWQREAQSVRIPDHILSAITAIRKGLAEKAEADEAEPLDYYISDRRWRKVVHLLRTSAFLNGRVSIAYSDLLLLIHVLWNKVECIEPILTIVSQAIVSDINKETTSIEKECEKAEQEKAKTSAEEELAQYKVFEYFYLGLSNYPKGQCLFNQVDFKNISTQKETDGILYYEDRCKAYIIRHFDKNMQAFDTSGKKNVAKVKLRRVPGYIVVDGIPYPFIKSGRSTSGPPVQQARLFGDALTDRIATAKAQIQQRCREIRDAKNLFVASEDERLVQKQAKLLEKRLDVVQVKVNNL